MLFCSVWFDFCVEVDFLYGYCIDYFYFNFCYQCIMFVDLSYLFYIIVINIKGVKIELIVGVIIDDCGFYIGNILEWCDVIEEFLCDQ